jgi:polyphosphate glucokinase
MTESPAIAKAPTASKRSRSTTPRTLVFDIGGTGLKATVLDRKGEPLHERVRIDTGYPCPPERLVTDLVSLTDGLPTFQRVSAGFPGVVRSGLIVTAPQFVSRSGPGGEVDDALVEQWVGFDLAGALAAALGAPTRVGNDADVQGAGVVRGHGIELVLTLGTGLGSAVFHDGRLAVHLELAHHVAHDGLTYNEYIGDRARKKVGNKQWNRRVRSSLQALNALIGPDVVLLGGGNAARVDLDKLRSVDPALATRTLVVGNEGGLLGGIRLWDAHHPLEG